MPPLLTHTGRRTLGRLQLVFLVAVSLCGFGFLTTWPPNLAPTRVGVAARRDDDADPPSAPGPRVVVAAPALRTVPSVARSAVPTRVLVPTSPAPLLDRRPHAPGLVRGPPISG